MLAALAAGEMHLMRKASPYEAGNISTTTFELGAPTSDIMRFYTKFGLDHRGHYALHAPAANPGHQRQAQHALRRGLPELVTHQRLQALRATRRSDQHSRLVLAINVCRTPTL